MALVVPQKTYIVVFYLNIFCIYYTCVYVFIFEMKRKLYWTLIDVSWNKNFKNVCMCIYYAYAVADAVGRPVIKASIVVFYFNIVCIYFTWVDAFFCKNRWKFYGILIDISWNGFLRIHICVHVVFDIVSRPVKIIHYCFFS